MTSRTADATPMVWARTAGLLYLIAGLPAPFALVYLPSRLIVRGDAAATAANILASEGLYRLGILTLIYNAVLSIFLVLALYRVLQVVNKNAASLMVIFTLVAVPISLLNELNSLAVLMLLKGGDTLSAFTTTQLQSMAYFFLRLHGQGINIAQIFWGLWLFPLGYLIYKSGFIPRWIGVLLIIACFGYVIQSIAAFLGYNLSIIFYTGWGEMVILLWLLIKGVNVEQWHQRAAGLAASSQ
jgi:hypothetical protein